MQPTNHLDLESIDALAVGLRSFEGAVVLVSHNASFMQSVCNELWVVESGSVVANKQARSAMVGESDSEDEREDEGFAMFFDGYRRSVMKAIRTTGRA